jgi:hypothetical protein
MNKNDRTKPATSSYTSKTSWTLMILIVLTLNQILISELRSWDGQAVHIQRILTKWGIVIVIVIAPFVTMDAC